MINIYEYELMCEDIGHAISTFFFREGIDDQLDSFDLEHAFAQQSTQSTTDRCSHDGQETENVLQLIADVIRINRRRFFAFSVWHLKTS